MENHNLKALILNSGIGKRMGDLTKYTNKCMAVIEKEDTIIDRQIKLLSKLGIKNILITTGPFAEQLEEYCVEKYKDVKFEFVRNEKYEETNYIYSIFLAKSLLQSDIILLHGDLVFDESVLKDIIDSKENVMVVDSTLQLPEKDFKSVVEEGKIKKVGIEFFENALASQPLYKINENEWKKWLNKIEEFCGNGNVNVYAENALNMISEEMNIYPLDVKGRLCGEIDNLEDLDNIRKILANKEN